MPIFSHTSLGHLSLGWLSVVRTVGGSQAWQGNGRGLYNVYQKVYSSYCMVQYFGQIAIAIRHVLSIIYWTVLNYVLSIKFM